MVGPHPAPLAVSEAHINPGEYCSSLTGTMLIMLRSIWNKDTRKSRQRIGIHVCSSHWCCGIRMTQGYTIITVSDFCGRI